jgi:hypothetical protein
MADTERTKKDRRDKTRKGGTKEETGRMGWRIKKVREDKKDRRGIKS